MRGRILVVDDDPSILKTFESQLRRVGHHVATATSATDALNLLSEVDADLVITDLRMPGMDGLELLKRIRESGHEIDVLLITAHEDMRSATEAMKAGALDYLVKPLDLAQIELVVSRSLEGRAMRRRAERLAAEPAGPQSTDQLVGRDPRMIEIYKLVGTLAANRAPVLIRGETGTGKERIARAIHYTSNAAKEPFIAVNCTTLAETLLESELFGHVRGAFTGAVAARRGFLELAGEGTVFLDEIGDTSPAFQAKLLRVLDDGEYYAVGSDRSLRTEARFLAATHRPLERLVESGSFRQDLYYRLRVVEITVPPLRERRGDIALLAEHLLGKITRKLHADATCISQPALEVLARYDWPGNVRELENALTRAAVLARGTPILPSHLALEAGAGPAADPSQPTDRTLAAVEGQHVARTLAEEGWNKRRTAHVLGVSRSRLARLIERYDLRPPADPPRFLSYVSDTFPHRRGAPKRGHQEAIWGHSNVAVDSSKRDRSKVNSRISAPPFRWHGPCFLSCRPGSRSGLTHEQGGPHESHLGRSHIDRLGRHRHRHLGSCPTGGSRNPASLHPGLRHGNSGDSERIPLPGRALDSLLQGGGALHLQPLARFSRWRRAGAVDARGVL